jgi:hypothetical protein
MDIQVFALSLLIGSPTQRVGDPINKESVKNLNNILLFV